LQNPIVNTTWKHYPNKIQPQTHLNTLSNCITKKTNITTNQSKLAPIQQLKRIKTERNGFPILNFGCKVLQSVKYKQESFLDWDWRWIFKKYVINLSKLRNMLSKSLSYENIKCSHTLKSAEEWIANCRASLYIVEFAPKWNQSIGFTRVQISRMFLKSSRLFYSVVKNFPKSSLKTNSSLTHLELLHAIFMMKSNNCTPLPNTQYTNPNQARSRIASSNLQAWSVANNFP